MGERAFKHPLRNPAIKFSSLLMLDSGSSHLFHPPLNPLPSREGKSKELDLMFGSARNDGSKRLWFAYPPRLRVAAPPCHISP